MSTKIPHLDSYEAALEAIMNDVSVGAEDRDYMDRAAAALMRIIRARRAMPASGISDAMEVASQKVADVDTDEEVEFYGDMSVAEATVEYFKTLEPKDPKRTTEIVKHLSEHGYPFSGEKPEQALTAAIRRRAGSIRDIVQVARGVWGLREWYTQKEITEFKHKERTKAGMEAAKARGSKLGKTPAINEAQAVELKRFLSEGKKHAEIGAIFGVTSATVGRYKLLLKDWNRGDPYPPEKPDKPDNAEVDQENLAQPDIRVVK